MRAALAPFSAAFVSLISCDKVNTMVHHQRKHKTYESTISSTDDDQEFAQIWSAVRKRRASVINNGCGVGCSKDWERAINSQWHTREVSDGRVVDSTNGRVLEGDDSAG